MLKLSDEAILKIADDIANLIRSKGSDKESLKRRQNRLSKPLELAFRKGIVILFKEQRDLVIAVLQGKEKSLKGTKENVDKAIAIPASKGETEKFAKYVLPRITEAVMIAGNDALAVLDIGVAFDVLNPRVIDWLKEHAAEAIKSIGETTKEALKKTLLEGVENGESIAKLMKRVQAEYKDLELEAWRAKRISMTEIKNATNQGNFQGILQSGLTGKKGILLGPKPCSICIGYEGRGEIDLNDTWDGFDCPLFHVGCQCDIYFVPD